MNLRARVLVVVLVIGTVGTAVTLLSLRHTPCESHRGATQPAPAPAPKVTTERLSIGRGDTLDELLGRAGIETPARVEMLAALKGVFDVRKFRAGTQLTLSGRVPW